MTDLSSSSRGRRPIAISTSFRSPVPSPSPSPTPSSPGGDGLSRRLSWSRPQTDAPSVSHEYSRSADHGQMRSLAPPSRTRLIPDDGPMEEYDLGLRDTRRSYDGNGLSRPRPWEGSSKSHRPFFHQADSTTSFDSNPSDGSPEAEAGDDRDQTPFAHPRSYPAPSSSSRKPRRVYDEQGLGISSGPRNLAASVTRSPTFRAVSNTLRKASVRVSSLMSPARENGRTRIPDGDAEDDKGSRGMFEMDPIQTSPVALDSGRPEGLPPEISPSGLRGRTLCLFGPTNPVRRGCSAVVNWPWAESAVLILIIVYAVILTVQSSVPIYEPRPGDGYFQSWEDWAILIIFTIFTVEMMARIITTGLLFDPETSVSAWLTGPNGIISRATHRAQRAHTNFKRSSITPSASRAAWRSTSTQPPQPDRKPTRIPEAPFQTAVQRQLDLSAAGRPYLRHSWHRVDLLSIVSFWITFFLASAKVEATDSHHIYIFRALSILRAGRLLVITSGTATILDSLKRAGPLLITVGFFVIFASTLFSIIGIQSFRGSFRRTCILTDPNNSSNIIDTGQHCGGHLDPVTLTELPYILLSGQPFSQGPKGYICPLNQVCTVGETNPEGNTMSFDNFFYALIQVVIIASINTWAPVMYAAMDTDYFASALYWIVGVIIINFWLINLVVAVVVNTFKGVRSDTRRSAFGADNSALGVDPNWSANDKKKEEGRLLRLYRKTEYFWVASILVSLVAQGYKTDDASESILDLLKTIELAITLAFDFEIALRIVAYFPAWREFVRSPRNTFDLFLAVTTSIIQIPAIATSSTYQWLTVFQLLRWYRFVLAFPRMKPLLLRLFGSITGLLNMTIFLFTMNFLAALFAVQLFRGDLGDEEFISFSQTYNAFLGMYQLFSSEDWSTVMYNAMQAEARWKQKIIAAVFLCCWLIFSYFIVLQMFVAVINENFQIAEEQKRKRQVEEFIRRGQPQSAHVSWIDRLNPYRLVKARHRALQVKSLPQNLVLPLKQTIGADVGGAGPAEKSDALEVSKRKLRKLFGREKDDSVPRYRKRPLSTLGQPVAHDDDYADDRGLTDLLPPVNANIDENEIANASRERRNQQADFIAAHPSFDRSLWIFKQTNVIRRFCQSCFEPAYGERIYGRPAHPILRLVAKMIIFATIIASVVVAAISTPIYRKWYYETNGYFRGSWYDIAEAGLSSVFILEAIMKIIADGFIFAPNAYLLSIWNIFDFIILLALLVNIAGSLIVIGGVNRLTRAMRSVRALRLITLFSRLRDTLHVVLFAGFINIVDALILMVLYIIPFAVWGLNIFSGAFFQCTDGTASGFSTCLGETAITPLDDSLGFLAPQVWSNPGLVGGSTVYSFDSFRQSMLILFEIVSLEGWIDVMQSATSITGTNNQPVENAAQWNSIFFIVFNLFGGVIILTLFVSIIIENFSMRSGMLLLTTEQRRWVDLSKFIKAQTPSQLPRNPPSDGIRMWCYRRATAKHGWWARMFTVIYYLHIILLAFEDFNNTIFDDRQIDAIFLLLTMIYAVDLLVRFFGLGMRSFWANGWNIFDLIVIAGSFATTIPALQAGLAGTPGSQGNVQLQKLFLVAIALKLVQRNSRLNQLFKTSVASLPAVGKLFLLWACLFIFYAIMFVEVFGLTKNGTASGTRFQNYNTFGNALVMLAFMSTGEGWNGYMHNYTLESPRCTYSKNFLNSDCGSPAWAYFLFISWNILSMYIFLNMFTGVVVESFAYVYQMPGGISLDREQMRAFKRVWADIDTRRTGYITRKELMPFLTSLSGVFEVRPYPSNMLIRALVRSSVPDPVDNAAGKLVVATGTRHAVDVRRVEGLVRQVDLGKIRERRKVFDRLYHEARITEEPGRGISFNSMLFMLAHYKLIDDEKALQLDDLLERRAKTERVTDLVNLDRVRGLLRTIYCRRRYLRMRDERRRAINEANGIPAIVLEPIAPSPEDEDDTDPFERHDYTLPESPTSSRGSRRSSPGPGSSPQFHPVISSRQNSPSLYAASAAMSHRGSDASMLSFDPSERGRDSLSDDERSRGNSPVMKMNDMWEDMMRQAEEAAEEGDEEDGKERSAIQDNVFTHAR